MVGATKRLRLIGHPEPALRGAVAIRPAVKGSPVPRAVAAPGTTLVARFRVANWVVARFALTHPGGSAPASWRGWRRISSGALRPRSSSSSRVRRADCAAGSAAAGPNQLRGR